MDLELRSASEEVDASPSLLSTTIASVDAALVKSEGTGGVLDLGRTFPVGCDSTWLSLTTGGVCPL